MKYAFEDLGHDQFERLIVAVCKKLFGIAVQGFAEGPDGGRDAKFLGTAEIFPSASKPWTGTTIIQAKHTNGYNKHFSENDFYSPTNASAVLTKEVVRIKALVDSGKLDCYFLVANRRLGANAESEIRSYISTECGLSEEFIYLCDATQLEEYLKEFKGVAESVDMNPLDSPLIVSPDDLADVVTLLSQFMKSDEAKHDHPPSPRITYEQKNELNNMSTVYANVMRRRYLKDTAQVKTFLSAPENDELLQKYEEAADEFNVRIIAKRKDYQNFDSVMNYLSDLLFARDPMLRKNKRLTKLMLFYMYWNCDIGEDGNVAAI